MVERCGALLFIDKHGWVLITIEIMLGLVWFMWILCFLSLYYNGGDRGTCTAVVSGSIPANLAQSDLGLFKLTVVKRKGSVLFKVHLAL